MTVKQPQILVIEQDEALKVRIAAALEGAGFRITTASNALEGLKKLYESYPDLVIMAKELPIINGEEPVFHFRQTSYLPILVLGSNEDGAEMLELGADAYIAKPPSLGELVARVCSLLRRKSKHEPPGDNLQPKVKDHLTNGGNGSNGLTHTEFRMASCLLLNKGRLVSYRRLIDEVWGGKTVSIDTLHFYIRRLRQKLTNGGIFMLRGVGCCFKADQTPLITT